MKREGEIAKACPTLKDFKVPWERNVGTDPAWMLSRASENWDKGSNSRVPGPVFTYVSTLPQTLGLSLHLSAPWLVVCRMKAPPQSGV